MAVHLASSLFQEVNKSEYGRNWLISLLNCPPATESIDCSVDLIHLSALNRICRAPLRYILSSLYILTAMGCHGQKLRYPLVLTNLSLNVLSLVATVSDCRSIIIPLPNICIPGLTQASLHSSSLPRRLWTVISEGHAPVPPPFFLPLCLRHSALWSISTMNWDVST